MKKTPIELLNELCEVVCNPESTEEQINEILDKLGMPQLK